MSEEATKPQQTEESGKSLEPAKTRRVSNVRVKKAQAPTKKKSEAGQEAAELKPGVGDVPVGNEGLDADEADTKGKGPDWSDSTLETVGGSSTVSEGAKRKRKRRRGKGGSQSEAVETVVSSGTQQVQRVRVDPELLSKSAWKIYLAEISEEGVALVGDHDARDLARRCFRLAEIFHEEQARRSGGQSKPES